MRDIVGAITADIFKLFVNNGSAADYTIIAMEW